VKFVPSQQGVCGKTPDAEIDGETFCATAGMKAYGIFRPRTRVLRSHQ
jgi:hypothetical protein